LNVTELRLVGSTHLKADQGFRRSVRVNFRLCQCHPTTVYRERFYRLPATLGGADRNGWLRPLSWQHFHRTIMAIAEMGVDLSQGFWWWSTLVSGGKHLVSWV